MNRIHKEENQINTKNHFNLVREKCNLKIKSSKERERLIQRRRESFQRKRK